MAPYLPTVSQEVLDCALLLVVCIFSVVLGVELHRQFDRVLRNISIKIVRTKERAKRK